MRILVVGGGGREHALAWALNRGQEAGGRGQRVELHAVPGNPGIAQIATCHAGNAENLPEVARLAEQLQPNLVVVGPEDPLCNGLVDMLAEKGMKAFGPEKRAAVLEGSKVFARQFMTRHGIPQPRFELFADAESARRHLDQVGSPVVVKADGLAKGKGAIVCSTQEEAERAIEDVLEKRVFGQAGERILIEERLQGQEATVKAFCDGQRLAMMVPSQDYKRVYDGDRGPNTGGMGCYSPVPAATPEIMADIVRQVMEPTLKGMADEGRPYKGVLYAGMMLTKEGPKVMEFNCRFGDPETQVVLPRLKTDLSEVLQACVEGRLGEVSLEWGDECAVCVVAASGGYPGEYEKGKVITGLEGPLPDQALVFHAGTARKGDALVTNGGRVLGITGLGKDFNEAREKAYKAMEQVHFDGMHYRQDIAANLLPRIGADSDGFRGLEGELLHADLTGKVIGAAMEVHRTLGPGFLESVYQEALAQEFRERQVPFERQKPVEVEYKGTVAGEFRADFLVAGRVLVELKAASALTALDEAQVVNYLRGTAAEVGILLNFGESSLRYRRLILTKKLKSAKSAANPRNPR